MPTYIVIDPSLPDHLIHPKLTLERFHSASAADAARYAAVLTRARGCEHAPALVHVAELRYFVLAELDSDRNVEAILEGWWPGYSQEDWVRHCAETVVAMNGELERNRVFLAATPYPEDGGGGE